jgi:hypothetical protein
MVLAPQEINTDIDDDGLKNFIKELSADYNVVVIVPSNKRAEFWEDCADQTLLAANIAPGVEKLKSGRVGVTVLVNKYDGIDLPDDACRVLVVDGLPEVQGLLERVEQSATEGTELSLRRQIQRIEQGMGRGVRSTDDFCVVLLSGAKLTNRLHNADGFDLLSPATQAQLRLSRQVADQLQGKALSEIKSVMELCLKRDPKWVSASKGALLMVAPPAGGTPNAIAIRQKEAFEHARAQQYQMAVDTLQAAVNEEKSPRTKGWLKQQVAEYKHHVDPVEAQKILLSAVGINRQVLRPLEGIAYTRLKGATGDQAQAAVDYYRDRFKDSNDLTIAANAILEDLNFEPETANAFESAVMELGQLLGFKAQRPENDEGKGPDDLWAVGELRYLVIECKNGATTAKVNKHDCNQLAGSMNWFKMSYDATCTAVPVLIHPSNAFEKAAAPHPGTRVMIPKRLDALKDNADRIGG